VARFVVDVSALRNLFAGANGPVFLEMRRRGNAVMREAKRLCPADTGTLQRSITLEMESVNGLPAAVVGSNLAYAIYVHEGTGLYSKRGAKLIRPVAKRSLAWPTINNSGKGRRRYKGGATAGYTFAMTSRGSPGRPFLTDAIKRVRL
jgi:phage gpG-like protein